MNIDRRPFSLIVVEDYFDGPMSGVAVAEDQAETVFFHIVGWDTDQWQRVYAISVVDHGLVARLIDSLRPHEEPRSPIWVLGRESVTPAAAALWSQVKEFARQRSRWELIESHDLTAIVERRELSSSESDRVTALIVKRALIDLDSDNLLSEFCTKLTAAPHG